MLQGSHSMLNWLTPEDNIEIHYIQCPPDSLRLLSDEYGIQKPRYKVGLSFLNLINEGNLPVVEPLSSRSRCMPQPPRL